MKTLISALVFMFAVNNLIGQENTRVIKYREQLSDTFVWPDHKKYYVDIDKDRFITIFIKSTGKVIAELQDSSGSIISEFKELEWLSNTYYIEYDSKFNGNFFVSINTASSDSAIEVKIDYKVNISSEDRALKDSIKIDNAIFSKMYYNFKLSEDRIISVGPSGELGAAGKLMYLDTKTNNFGIMYPLNDSTFYSPNSFLDSYSDDVRIIFNREGTEVTSMTWTEKDDTPLNAPLVYPSKVENIEFTNGDVKLDGILIKPQGKGPFPLIVFAHGSGATLRDQGFFLSCFLRYGFAVLSFDKRGAGRSSGDWVTSSFENLAEDIIRGIEFVKGTCEIDTAKVGLFGISQGGWVATIAAGKSASVRFLIINTGSGVSVNKNMAYEFECIMREKGIYSEYEINEMITFYYDLLEKATDGVPYDSIQKYISLKKDNKWLSSVPITNLPEKARWWTWQKLNGRYDNSILTSKLSCPVLWVLANNDKNVPFEISKKGIEEAIKVSGNKNFTLKHFTPSTHVMIESDTGYFSNDVITERKFVSGYWTLMEKWINSLLKK